MPNRTRIVLSLALLLAAALLALPAMPAQSQGLGLEPRILYSANIDRDVVYFIMNADGSNKQIVSDILSSDSESWSPTIGASLSPGGDLLTFGALNLAESTASFSDTTIYMLDLKTNIITPLVTEGYTNRYPVWSPDGSAIAYLAYGENAILNAVDVATGEVRSMLDASVTLDLVGTGGFVRHFDWSPDGSRLAASVQLIDLEAGGYGTVFVLNADGSNVFQVFPPYTDAYSPAWGPQGDALYFVCDPSGSGDFEAIEICLIDLTTSEVTQVTRLGETLNIRAIRHMDVSMREQIVFDLFVEEPDIPGDIYRYDPATGELVNLTADIDVGVYAPRWIESPPAKH